MSIQSYCRIIRPIKNCINLCQSHPVLVQCRNTYRTSFSLCNQLNVRLFSAEHKNNNKQIYYGPLTPQIKAIKIFSLSSSVVGIVAQPFLYNEIASTGNVPVIIAAYTAIGFFTVLTPVLLHLITKKYVTHLNYKEDTNSYIAKTVNFFCIIKKTEFSPDDVTVPDVPGIFTTFHVKGKAMFIDSRMFDQPEHYASIMGFDKPLDFKLYQTAENVDGSTGSNSKKLE